MKNLTLGDLRLALHDLLERRAGNLRKLVAAPTYLHHLTEKLGEIEALPAELTAGRPLVDELSESDDRHDALGGAIWYLTEAYSRCPDVDASIKAAAARIRKEFVPMLSELMAPFADEADRALERKKTLELHKPDLQLFPIAGGKTLYDWTRSFLDAGEGLHELLSRRANDAAAHKTAGQLRSKTLGVLTRLRAAIADEVAANAELPRDLEVRCFSYIDELAAARVAQRMPAPQPA